MSKYKLTKLLSEVQGGRIGTIDISARGLEMTMEDLEQEGVTVNRFYDSPDGKTHLEYHVHPDGSYNPDTSFSVYDYKFGEDPTDYDNDDKEYPFSIGGKSFALKSAVALLGLDSEETIDENEAVDLAIEASQEKAGIEVNENTIEEEVIKENLNPEVSKKVNQLIKAMAKKYGYDEQDAVYAVMAALKQRDFDGVKEDATELDENTIEEGAMKSIISALGEYGNESEIEMYMDSLRKSGDSFDDVEDYVEDFKNYIADKSLQEHFGRFMQDYQ